MEILMLVCLLLSVVVQLCAIRLLVKAESNQPLPKSEKTKAEPAEEKPDPMDEGFENIMQYSVNGQTGFEKKSLFDMK